MTTQHTINVSGMIELNKCPGYFVNIKDNRLYSIKSGIVKPLKLSRIWKYQCGRIRPTNEYGYRISNAGRRLTVPVSTCKDVVTEYTKLVAMRKVVSERTSELPEGTPVGQSIIVIGQGWGVDELTVRIYMPKCTTPVTTTKMIMDLDIRSLVSPKVIIDDITKQLMSAYPNVHVKSTGNEVRWFTTEVINTPLTTSEVAQKILEQIKEIRV